MEKKLNIKQLCIETLSFSAKNFFLLAFFSILLFLASYLSIKYAFKHQTTMLCLYGCFCYFFYYTFISLYYEQKPLFTSEKVVNSLIKAAIIFSLSLLAVICGHLTVVLLKYMSQWLIGFPDVYTLLKNTYGFLNGSALGRFLLYVPVIILLTFTFFIPGFAWISVLNGGDSSLMSAFSKAQGNYMKIILLLLVLFTVLPVVFTFLFSHKTIYLSLSHTIVSMIQLVFYIRLYDFFYQD